MWTLPYGWSRLKTDEQCRFEAVVTFRVRLVAWVFANRLPLYPVLTLPG